MLVSPIRGPISPALDRAIRGGGALPWEDAGGSAPWTPARLPALTLWLRGGVGLTQVAGPKISAWADQSGGARDFTQATDANRPTVATLAGVSVPKCSNTGPLRLAGPAASGFVSASAYHIFMVVRQISNASTARLFGDVAETQGPFVRCTSVGAAQAIHVDSVGLKATTTIALTSSAISLVEMSYDGTTIRLSASGTSATVAAGSVVGLTNTTTLGPFEGDVGAVVICSAYLSAADRVRTRDYLVATYGATP